MSRPSVDDSALRAAAADLIASARRQVPIIALALHAVEKGIGTLTVETSIGPDGATTTLVVFDDRPGPEGGTLARPHGASALALGHGGSALAQQTAQGQATEVAPGVTRRVVAEVPSVVPGFAKVSLVEVTWQPGGKIGPSTMKDAMICEMSEGALDETKNGQPVPRKEGDVWTCAVGDVDIDVNNGTVPATMRIFSLIKA